MSHECQSHHVRLFVLVFDADIRLTTTLESIALGNGALKEIIELPDKKMKTTIYQLTHRCPSYLICLAVGDYVEFVDESVDNMPIKYYAPKNFPTDVLKVCR